MPVYSHPELVQGISQELRKDLKGKSCFNIKKQSHETLKHIEDILTKGIAKYEELNWI